MTVGIERVGGLLSADEETFENIALSLCPSLCPFFNIGLMYLPIASSIIKFYKEMDVFNF